MCASMCEAVTGNTPVAAPNPGPSTGATPNPELPGVTVDPYGADDGPMVDDGSGEDMHDDEIQKLEAKKKAKRERMKFNRSLESALPRITVHSKF